MPSVVNAHWYGGTEKLPPGTVYIGRPSAHGNRHSSKTGGLSKEECVAFHRVDLYDNLISVPGYFAQLQAELMGHDLACWCKQQHKVCACHGDNFFHIFDPSRLGRLYDKSVFHYLMDDLLVATARFEGQLRALGATEDTLFLSIGYEDMRVQVGEMVRLFGERKTDPYLRCAWLAAIVVDLELAYLEETQDDKWYRLNRCCWNAFRFECRPQGREGEPVRTGDKVRAPKKP